MSHLNLMNRKLHSLHINIVTINIVCLINIIQIVRDTPDIVAQHVNNIEEDKTEGWKPTITENLLKIIFNWVNVTELQTWNRMLLCCMANISKRIKIFCFAVFFEKILMFNVENVIIQRG